MATFMHSLETVYVLWLRAMKRYVRSPARMFGTLGQPILFLLALGFGFGPIYAAAGEGSYLQFLAPGVIAMSVLFTAMFSGIDLIWDRQFGFLKETLVAPVSRFAIMVGRTLGGATVAFAQGVIVFLISLMFGFSPTNWFMLPLAFVFIFIVAMLFTTIGTIIASKLSDMQAFPLIMNFIIMPLFFLSGALFPLKELPAVLKVLISLNPLTYGVDAIRGTLAGTWYFNVWIDGLVLVALLVIAYAIGSYMFKKIQL